MTNDTNRPLLDMVRAARRGNLRTTHFTTNVYWAVGADGKGRVDEQHPVTIAGKARVEEARRAGIVGRGTLVVELVQFAYATSAAT
jgi:hypothetical protein